MAERASRIARILPAVHVAARTTISMVAIRRFARQIAKQFQPEKIILFGSFAYGKPNAGSDVDLLVIMPTRNELDQAVRICSKVSAPFPFDLIVRKPEEWKWRIEAGESFSTQILTKGKILYEKGDARMGEESRIRSPRRKRTRRSRPSRT